MNHNRENSQNNSPYVTRPEKKADEQQKMSSTKKADEQQKTSSTKKADEQQKTSSTKKVEKKKHVPAYLFTAFFVIMALGTISESLLTAGFMLLAAVLTCPFTVKYFDSIWNKIFRKEKGYAIKRWIYGVAAGIIFIIGCYSAPTSGKDISLEETISKTEYQTEEELDKEQALSQRTTEKTTVVKKEAIKKEAKASAAPSPSVIPTKSVKEKAQTSVAESAEEKKQTDSDGQTESMEVHFIDVGQGDSTLIRCGDQAMLIDAGDNSKGTTVQLYLKKQGVTKLDYLVLTHPDADHIGGADVIVTKFDIDNMFMSPFTKDNKTYNELKKALEYKSLKWSTPNVGNQYTLGSATFTIIAPNATYSTPNNSSVGLIIQNGENRFLFTGDAEEEAESDIVANGISISADVYQVGHHGSRTASSSTLLQAVKPAYAVISCGEDNSYGHPHAQTLNSLRAMGVKVFRTDEQGSVVATSDGKNISWNCSPSETWKAGESTDSGSAKKTAKSSTKKSASQSSGTTKENSGAENTDTAKEAAPVEAAVQQQSPADDLSKVDTNGNGKVTIAEAKAAGYAMPITEDHWLYQYMDDRDGDGMVGE